MLTHADEPDSCTEALQLFDKSELAFSLRDLSELTGISFQRVQQVLSDIRERSEEYLTAIDALAEMRLRLVAPLIAILASAECAASSAG